MSDQLQPIIIKKKKVSGGGHHGGAWKVAYADFVTAMMAFFLLMWILNSTSEEQRMGLADYFSPTVSITSSGSGASGMMKGGDVMQAPDNNLQSESSGQEGPSQGKTISEAYSEMTSKDAGGKIKDEDVSESAILEQQGDPVEGLSETEGESIQAVLKEQEQAQFESAAAAISAAVESIPDLAELKDSLKIDISEEGLKIQLSDQENYSMFESGSNRMKPESKSLLAMLAIIINGMENKLIILGHTDAVPFRGADGRDNWDLSTERANASRRVLLESGIDADRIAKVVGKGPTELLHKDKPEDASNRRIELILKRVHKK